MTITNTKAKDSFWVKIKKFPSWIKKHLLCPLTCFLNLFFITSLTLGTVYIYYINNSAKSEVQLCRSNETITPKQGNKIQCCNSNSYNFWFCKVVEKTTQATIILMLVILGFLSLEVYCECDKQKQQNNAVEEETTSSQKEPSKENQSAKINLERRNNVITILIATLGVSAIPTGISLIICAFNDMQWMQLLSGVEIYIAFAGISIISVAFLSVSDEEKGNLGMSGISYNLIKMQKQGAEDTSQQNGKYTFGDNK
jgi:hypothetical protein